MRATCLIRQQPGYRADAFARGLQAAGYQVTTRLPSDVRPDDVLVIWNRYSTNHEHATRYEKAGATVLVAENGYLGREWNGDYWYAIAKSQHNGAGEWPRIDRPLNINPHPWRASGEHVLVLPQRGIGPPGVAMPSGWVKDVLRRLDTSRPVKVRQHPGEHPAPPLERDLANAWCVVTWGSGAALKSALHGIPVFYDFPRWIGAPLGKRFDGGVAHCEYPDRHKAFESIAGAMWRLEEIESGEPFRRLLWK